MKSIWFTIANLSFKRKQYFEFTSISNFPGYSQNIAKLFLNGILKVVLLLVDMLFLTLKVPITSAADDTFKLLFIFFYCNP